MPHPDKHTRKSHERAESVREGGKAAGGLHHNVEETDRPDTPELEGGPPLPEELTGRASSTSEDLTALFDNISRTHLTDGFRGGSADEPSPGDRAGGTTDP